jgi:hypothetical protein
MAFPTQQNELVNDTIFLLLFFFCIDLELCKIYLR